jgi:hypothetical protein
MGRKLEKGTFPDGHKPDDFKAFGPPATKDGEFDTVKICDMGCFKQGDVDSNKYYHAMICQSKVNGRWYVYFEWGRTGAKNPSFQFVECTDEADAQREFAAQLHEKNDRRGQWVTIAGVRTLQAKPGKDCYLVRPQAARSTGLPDARTIKLNEGAKAPSVQIKGPTVDTHTLKLMRDLSVATVSYTRGSMADSSLPTQTAIDEARTILTEAQKRLLVVGDSVEQQVKDNDLVQLTSVLYSRIPKRKPVGAAASTWILSKDNISLWTVDLDAFESALYVDGTQDTVQNDPFAGMPLKMEWVDPTSELGKFLYTWWPRASANRHGYLKSMTIKNLWKVDRFGDDEKLAAQQEIVLRGKHRFTERPLFQPERVDLKDTSLMRRWQESNTALLLHGTRSVNLVGILKESFRLPKQLVGVVITGSMFGPLIYMADDWRKSAGYTSLSGGYYSAGAGGVRGRDAFMFACDVVCGKAFVAPGPYGYTAPPAGHHCIFGKGGVSQVQNNEWVIPTKDQIRIRYLVEFIA